ncbi:hypothetical protein M2324_004040, partial [Rhodovulum sulfidophilum]|nr:hypothetical protein [Rhodovulum sulfidophilum]
ASIFAVQRSARSGCFLAIKARDVMPTISSFLIPMTIRAR